MGIMEKMLKEINESGAKKTPILIVKDHPELKELLEDAKKIAGEIRAKRDLVDEEMDAARSTFWDLLHTQLIAKGLATEEERKDCYAFFDDVLYKTNHDHSSDKEEDSE